MQIHNNFDLFVNNLFVNDFATIAKDANIEATYRIRNTLFLLEIWILTR